MNAPVIIAWNKHHDRNEAILDAWMAGGTYSTIGDEYSINKDGLDWILYRARSLGDPRAVSRGYGNSAGPRDQERADRILTMIAKGESYTRIAEILGISRGAVARQVFAARQRGDKRVVPAKARPAAATKQGGAPAKRKRKAEVAAPKSHPLRLVVCNDPLPQVRPAEDSAPVHLLSVQSGQCRFPLWDEPRKPLVTELFVCGAPVAGTKHYCGFHCALVYDHSGRVNRKEAAR